VRYELYLRFISVLQGLTFIDTLDEVTLLTVASSCYPLGPVDRCAPVSRSLSASC
jgi:hypothetical protein